MLRPSGFVRNLIILAFLVRGAFYCMEQPLWEGFDEWAHFGYIQHLARYARPPSRSTPVSDEVQRSIELAPLSASAAEPSLGSVTYDVFWHLPAEARLNRERGLSELRPSYRISIGGGVLRQYEAQQPPLYYLIMTWVYASVKNASLPAQVLALRLGSLLISAIGIWLCWKLASQVPSSRYAATPILLLLASWPGLMIDACRIGNDGLALALSSALLLSLFRIVLGGSRLQDWSLAGAVLGACLLTKAYMLALVPLLLLVVVIEALRSLPRGARAGRGLLVALVLAGLIAGWWYVATWRATGTLSGEQIDAAASARLDLPGKLAAIWSVRWLKVLDSAATMHIWTGGWSLLGLRSWMYRTFECLAIAAAGGLTAAGVRFATRTHRRGLGHHDACLYLVASAYLLFCAGVAYYALVVYISTGASITIGWYLWGIAGGELVMFATGFTGLVGVRRAAGCIGAAAALASVLDLYTVHFVSAPYYAGLIGHFPSGLLAAFHPAISLRDIGLGGFLARLAVNEPAGLSPAGFGTLWISYLCATLGLLAYSAVLLKSAFFPKRKTELPPQERSERARSRQSNRLGSGYPVPPL